MPNNNQLKLIEGVFLQHDAKEILMKIFLDKINHHKIKNWSSQERFGKDDEIAQARIPELKAEMLKLQEILSEAKAEDKKLEVHAIVNIKLIDN